MFLAYPFMALASLAFAALTMILAPMLALFSDADGNLPGAMRLFQTFDAALDAGWKDGYFRRPRNRLELWWMRVRWLWRNPGYTFDSKVLGCAFDPSEWRVLASRPDGSLFIAIGPGGRFDVMGQIGLRFKFGWKASHYWQGDHFSAEPWGPDMRAPICCTISR